jgi:hypothetical protein
MDLRRDVDRITFQFMKANIAPDMRTGFRSSIRSSYTVPEIEAILREAGLGSAIVSGQQMGLTIVGRREY